MNWWEFPLDRGWIPDAAIRAGIRRLCAARLREEQAANGTIRAALLREMREGPIAIDTAAANEQHYEVPSEFFRLVLGPRLKYSACSWTSAVRNLADAETLSLGTVAERAQIADGQKILELGCGWGSLSLYLAERFPGSTITAVSNSGSQKEFIESEARRRGLANVRVVTADMRRFKPDDEPFDRVVSVEMFEHMRNWKELLRRVASWSTRDAVMFVHVFAHRRHAYPFETNSGADWMARHFFTGGIMPSVDLLPGFRDDWRPERQWTIGGENYRRTAEAWLENLDRNRGGVEREFARVYGAGKAPVLVRRWRVFFMACAELFGFAGGSEWLVAQYTMRRG